MMLPPLALSIAALVVNTLSGVVAANNNAVGPTFNENPANKFKPINDFDANRLAFYKHERIIATDENPRLRNTGGDYLRVAHFDAHWHGLTVQEYLGLQQATRAHILVARGVPEREGYSEAVRKRLNEAGFDHTSVVESPCASLTSGLVIGVRQGITILNHQFHTLEGRHVALEAIVRISSHVNPIHLIALTLDANDGPARIRQLQLINKHIMKLQAQSIHYMVLGGLWGHVRFSSEARVLQEGGVNAKDAFFAAQRLAPLYTSWLGDYTDTSYISESLMPAVKDSQVWHAEVDCLPVLVDLDMKVKLPSPVPHVIDGPHKGPDYRHVDGQSQQACNNMLTSFIRRNWKVILLSLSAFLAAIAVVVVLARFMKRPNRGDLGRPIQATGGKYNQFADPDAKLKGGNSQKTQRSETTYEDEKK